MMILLSPFWWFFKEAITLIIYLDTHTPRYLILPLVLLLLVLFIYFHGVRKNRVYLVDFECYKPPDFCRVSISTYLEHATLSKKFDDESVDFMRKTIQRSGLGNETCVPEGIHQLPPDLSFAASKTEIEDVLFATIEQLFDKHGLDPTSIDILISNCGGFCPIPSICSMVIHKFELRSNVMSYNMSGMGCSAGLLAVSLAQDLLRVHKNSVALVLSIELLTPHTYPGKVKSMLIPNCLFRTGGVAILMGNRAYDKKRAKYVLEHVERTHRGFQDKSYNCISMENDPDGHVGIILSRDIIEVAAEALRVNLTALGPKFLPLSEQLHFALSFGVNKLVGKGSAGVYVPDFRKAFQHFCIHAGGRAIIDAVEKNLGLTEKQVEASKMTLFRFGNTSSSSVWYELGYLEAKRKIRKGDKVWQIALGSGFKCNSVVWKCVSDFVGDDTNAWSDRIDKYPAVIPSKLYY